MAEVLVIDDDPSLLRASRPGVQAAGHDVVDTTSGEQGIPQTALSPPDVVVLDLGLPDFDGQPMRQTIPGVGYGLTPDPVTTPAQP